MKHLILYFVLCTSFFSFAQRGYTYRPVQEQTPPVQIYFGHIKSAHTSVEELLKVDSIVLFQPDIEEKYYLLKCDIVIYNSKGKVKFGGLNYIDHFDESFKSIFKRLKTGDVVLIWATLNRPSGPAMKMANNVQIE